MEYLFEALPFEVRHRWGGDAREMVEGIDAAMAEYQSFVEVRSRGLALTKADLANRVKKKFSQAAEARRLLADGLPIVEIGARLGVSPEEADVLRKRQTVKPATAVQVEILADIFGMTEAEVVEALREQEAKL